MRGYECYLHFKFDNNRIEIGNHSCFAGINNYSFDSSKLKLPEEFVKKGLPSSKTWVSFFSYRLYGSIDDNLIYIDRWEDVETKKYVDKLIKEVNKVTPCFLEGKFIVFKLLSTFDQSLVLLNFIRNLWYCPPMTGRYTSEFFEILSELDHEDGLISLTEANLKACTSQKITYSPTHCNIHSYSQLKVKTTKELLSYKGLSTQTFLTT